MSYYLLVFFASLLVDLVPFFGPPAWMVMVFFQVRYGLNTWYVISIGVLGSALGRYILSLYMPYISDRMMGEDKKRDMAFIGDKMHNNKWKVRLFALLYTLLPLPSTPLFTAAGVTRVSAINIIPSFLVGKFVSDTAMVLSADFAARNALAMLEGYTSWKSIAAVLLGLLLMFAFFFTDWRELIQHKRFRMTFNIWK